LFLDAWDGWYEQKKAREDKDGVLERVDALALAVVCRRWTGLL
jgi:hypothetical protein